MIKLCFFFITKTITICSFLLSFFFCCFSLFPGNLSIVRVCQVGRQKCHSLECVHRTTVDSSAGTSTICDLCRLLGRQSIVGKRLERSAGDRLGVGSTIVQISTQLDRRLGDQQWRHSFERFDCFRTIETVRTCVGHKPLAGGRWKRSDAMVDRSGASMVGHNWSGRIAGHISTATDRRTEIVALDARYTATRT